MSDFDFKRDFKFIDWKSTALTALYRSIAAGLTWMIILLFADTQGGIGTILLAPVLWPVAYFVIFLPLGYITATLSRMGVPYIGLISIVCSFLFIVGDPILWIFNKITEGKYIPVRDLNFINFTIILFVVDEERRNAASVA